MLQRVQTLFLLLAAAAMLVASVAPLAFFVYDGKMVVFEAMGTYLNDVLNDSTWGLFAVGMLSSVMFLITVFLYKRRMLQIRLSIFNIGLMIGFYLYAGFLLYKLNSNESMAFQKVGIGIIMPAIALILAILAIRKIGADEALIRSLNRLRK